MARFQFRDVVDRRARYSRRYQQRFPLGCCSMSQLTLDKSLELVTYYGIQSLQQQYTADTHVQHLIQNGLRFSIRAEFVAYSERLTSSPRPSALRATCALENIRLHRNNRYYCLTLENTREKYPVCVLEEDCSILE
eukprot:COSAG02_NODE_19261_length_891_cov_5.000000_2_plen_136_part_00